MLLVILFAVLFVVYLEVKFQQVQGDAQKLKGDEDDAP